METESIKLIEEWFEGATDVQRWEFVLANKDLFTVYLDNDETFIALTDPHTAEDQAMALSFFGYLGNNGAFALLKALGINAENA